MGLEEFVKNPVLIDEDIDLIKAANILVSKKVESFLYIKNNEVLGVISRIDLLKNFGKDAKISQIMNTKFKKIDVGSNIDNARAMLKDCNILLVEKKGKILGVITARSLVSQDDDPGDFLFE